jgi:hypothetical protein
MPTEVKISKDGVPLVCYACGRELSEDGKDYEYDPWVANPHTDTGSYFCWGECPETSKENGGSW